MAHKKLIRAKSPTLSTIGPATGGVLSLMERPPGAERTSLTVLPALMLRARKESTHRDDTD